MKSFANRYRAIFTVIILLSGSVVPAQEPIDLPQAYRGISLGMSPDDVKVLLRKDPWFSYLGEASLSLLERPRASLIDAGGSLFIGRGLFQFEEDALVAIILELKAENIDWYTVYSSLQEKYGPPKDMDPGKAWWENDSTRLALERPLTVKYLNLDFFDALKSNETDRKTWREDARVEFLDEL